VSIGFPTPIGWPGRSRSGAWNRASGDQPYILTAKNSGQRAIGVRASDQIDIFTAKAGVIGIRDNLRWSAGPNKPNGELRFLARSGPINYHKHDPLNSSTDFAGAEFGCCWLDEPGKMNDLAND
jgi:hypothetical protein